MAQEQTYCGLSVKDEPSLRNSAQFPIPIAARASQTLLRSTAHDANDVDGS